MRILLIYPDIATIQFYHFQHGLAWISAVLKQAGHRADLLYLNRELPAEEVVSQARAFAPDLIGISSTTLQYQFSRAYARELKRSLKVPLVLGGIHATIAPAAAMQEGLFDFLVRGEGEYPLRELADALERGGDWRGIKNLCWREGGELKCNPLRPPVELEALPFPDRELFDEERILAENYQQLPVMASRGCLFSCSYCCNIVLKELAGGARKWHRRRSVEKVMQELELLHARRPRLKSVIFVDEVFTTDPKWERQFCEQYRSRFRTPFQIYVRVGTADFERLKRLREAGLYSIQVGVESGDERIRREVLNRGMSDEKIIELFQWADRLGIESWSFNMVGMPGETEATLKKTMRLNEKLFPDHLHLAFFQPFPGTPLYERCVAEGLMTGAEPTSIYLKQPKLKLPGLSSQRLKELYDEFLALGWLWEARKGKLGYQDLSGEFDSARVQAGGDKFVMLWLVRVCGENRLSILIHPPSSVSWKVKLKKGSRLKFGASFSPDVWEMPGEGCDYLVKVKPRFGGEETVFEKYLDPKHNPGERRWNDFEVDLSAYGGKMVELKLETRTRNGNEYCAAFWSRPHLVVGGVHGASG